MSTSKEVALFYLTIRMVTKAMRGCPPCSDYCLRLLRMSDVSQDALAQAERLARIYCLSAALRSAYKGQQPLIYDEMLDAKILLTRENVVRMLCWEQYAWSRTVARMAFGTPMSTSVDVIMQQLSWLHQRRFPSLYS